MLRAGAWTARGLRVPARNALLADVVPAAVYGRAYGFERAMDNLGAIGGPLLAIALVGLIGVRSAILLSIIPGLLAALAIVYAIRAHRLADSPRAPADPPARPPAAARQARPAARGSGRVRVREPRRDAADPPRHRTPAARAIAHLRAQLALVLYTAYNLAATLASIPAGHVGDRHGLLRVLAGGATCFLIAYLGFAFTGESFALLAVCFILAGIGIGCAETAETAAVAGLAPSSSEAPRSGCSPPSKPSATSPPARSPECSGPRSHPPPRSSTSPPGWLSRSQPS